MKLRVLVYGDVNLHFRDGSAIWLLAIAECLRQTGVDVHVLLKADAPEDRVVDVAGKPGITIHTPFDDRVSGVAGMGARQAAQRIAILDGRHRFDVIISRGYEVACQLAISGRFSERMWPYFTEGPMFTGSPSERDQRLIAKISEQSRRIFVQTEDARSIVESLAPAFAGRVLLMNPIVPDEAFELGRGGTALDEPQPDLSLVYAGKFARLWNTLEMTRLPEQLAERGIESEVHLIGDKFQKTGDDQSWVDAMRAAVTSGMPGLIWRDGMARSQVLQELTRHSVALCWRSVDLDASHEVSTKVLEASAVGTPPLVNRTAMHEAIFGHNYPLFVDDDDPLATLERAVARPKLIDEAATIARGAVVPYSMAATVVRFEGYFRRAFGSPDPETRTGSRRLRVVVAGHDFKFAAELLESLRQAPDVELRIDAWHRLASHDATRSAELAAWADCVICEWAGPNAVFYSQRKRPGQRILVRFHGFELRGKWLPDIDVRAVDAFAFVSDFYRREVLRQTGWPENKTTVIYNSVDKVDLDRPKLPGAQFHIGMAGYVPILKRPDRAISLLRGLLEKDERYYLHIRGRDPWDYPWEWDKPVQQDAYREMMRSLADDEHTRSHVIFEPFGPDMANWFRRIGWVVSPSTRETFHLAPVEGMASGTLPLVWDRDGADEIFGEAWVHGDTESCIDFVLAARTEAEVDELREEVRKRARTYDSSVTGVAWMHLVRLAESEPIPLNGTSILDGLESASNEAEATALFHRALDRGYDELADVARDNFDLLPTWARDEFQSWERLRGWADRPERILPAPGLASLYLPRRGVVGSSATGAVDGALAVIPHDELPRVGERLDHQVLAMADAWVRAARRERVAEITGAGTVPAAFAALIAARRLGIPFRLGALELHDKPGVRAEIEELLVRKMREAEQALAVEAPRRLADVRIGLVADAFTAETIANAVQTVRLGRKTAVEMLEGLDAVIVESAWEGREREWFHGIAYHGEEDSADLRRLLAACEKRGIPTIFWNKEDPVHFRSFRLTASWFDHVFTTDADKIPAYLASEGTRNESVASLSFFAEPSIHNPLPSSRAWSPTVAFSGTYYGDRYPQRSAELRGILEEAATRGLTIYDRQKGLPDSPYGFPPEFDRFSRGSVPHYAMPDVSRSHPIHINVNSVADSMTMFSRRVVEVAASGSAVVSGVGRGVEMTLGSSFPVLKTREQWRDLLEATLRSEATRLEIVWGEMRAVFRGHRADQALTLMLRTAGLPVNPEPSATYALRVDNAAALDALAQQTVRPIITTDDPAVEARAAELGLSTDTDADFVGVSPSVTVPEHHYEDLLFAALFSDADCISVIDPGTTQGPILEYGTGDLSSALWRADLADPKDAARPVRWRRSGLR